MSDFQDRRPAHRDPAGPRRRDGQQPRRRGDDQGPVHQAVFRWEGNQGRQGTGMKAVAHSCPAELADELGRELGRLLWVSGTAAPRQSVVRTRTADGRIMLVRRWPTTDRGGRPSTVSHALIGDARTLGTEKCLGLTHGGWGSTRESAERAAGELKLVDLARLEPRVSQWLSGMTGQLETVRRTLILVAAEWLRDPEQRVSLLTDEVDPGGGLGPDDVPLVYLGLYRLFGSWLGRDWTFATYDTSDTHQLRLMCVSRWEPDAGGSGPLARITGRMAGERKFEHLAAARLVDHLLAHPAAAPGVPQLTDLLRDGAALGWQRRRVLLNEILEAEHRRGARATAPPQRHLDTDHDPEETDRLPEEPPRAPDRAAAEGPSDPWPEHPAATPAAERPAPPPEPLTPPPPAVPPAPASPAPPASPTHRSGPPAAGYTRADDSYAAAPAAPAARLETALHEELLDHRRGDTVGRGVLAERMRAVPDELLLAELRADGMPQESVELLLDELGSVGRVSTRPESMRHELCAEALRNGLYFAPNRPGADSVSRTVLAEQSAALFTWAVAPLARDGRYLRDLQELLHRMSRDRNPAAGNWLRQSITDPPLGSAPDLPPVLWQQLLRDRITQTPVTYPAPRTQQPPPSPLAPAPAPVPAPDSPSATREPPTWLDRLTERTNQVGCVVGSSLGLVLVAIAAVLIFG
ncbi:hypothetical protein EDD93_1879 [Streptomyces sp. 840.1]|uniref:hypothetical protein n=1 Tax=Streptomyces sp. 840.1 TaxID=2485152 RepID=UPI000F47BA56|nr:hypothetical protein [Streptomyces sp. 840.1]ROQ67443.1 hypothetical protein EDD93_1879 [Streptomyces sp. 840.1]